MATQQEFDAIIKEVLGNRGKGASKGSAEYQAARDQAAKRLSGGRSTAFKPDAPAAKKSKSKSKSGGKKVAPSKGPAKPSPRLRTPEEGPIPEARPGSDLPQIDAPGGLEWLLPVIAALFRRRGGDAGAPSPDAPGRRSVPGIQQTQPVRAANEPVPTVRVPNEPDRPQGAVPPRAGQPALPPPTPAEPPVRGALTIEDADMGDMPDQADPRVQEMIKRAQAGTAGLPEFMADPARGMRPRTPITTDATPRFRVQ